MGIWRRGCWGRLMSMSSFLLTQKYDRRSPLREDFQIQLDQEASLRSMRRESSLGELHSTRSTASRVRCEMLDDAKRDQMKSLLDHAPNIRSDSRPLLRLMDI